jgi:hypothetical protein
MAAQSAAIFSPKKPHFTCHIERPKGVRYLLFIQIISNLLQAVISTERSPAPEVSGSGREGEISTLRHADLRFSICNRLKANIGSGAQKLKNMEIHHRNTH